ncbi:MAG TPA: ABC transporter permease subunit, partial [Phycisphaerae bacterium]|nr:ABC transporter permease subunit [Phycisphaerae bacterium]
AFLFFQAWPMLAVIAVLGLIALPGLRQMARWAEPPDEDLGVVRAAAWWPAVVLVGLISFLPFVVFCVELSTGRTTASVAVATAARTLWKSGVASMIVALVSALGAVCLAVALIDVETRRGALTVLRRIAFALLLVAAVLPPELIGISLVSVYAKIAGPSDWWSLYDRSPWPWAMGMVVRFGFLTACVGRFLVRHPAGELAASATLDGASPIERLVHARLPLIRGPLITAGIMVACLTMSEVAISLLVQPPRFIGGSFAVAVDSQMHYGRQNETVAGALMLAIPSMLAAGCAAAVTGRRAGK